MTLLRPRIGLSSWFISGILAIVAVSLPASRASATVIAGWDFNGLTNGGPRPFSASVADPAVTVTGLTRALAGPMQNAGANTWGTNALTAQNQAGAITAGSFFSFSITSVTDGVSLSNIGAYNVWLFDYNPTDLIPSNFFGAWQYRTGSNAFANIGSSFQLGTISQGAGNLQSSVDLSGLSGLQSMPAGTQADFRFVLWGGGYGSNYAGFNNFQSGADLIVNGTVAVVPEPSMWVLAAGGGLCCVAWNAFRRRTRPVRDGR